MKNNVFDQIKAHLLIQETCLQINVSLGVEVQ